MMMKWTEDTKKVKETENILRSNIENLKKDEASWDLFEQNMHAITSGSWSKSRCLIGVLMKELREKLEDKKEWKVEKIKDKRRDEHGRIEYQISWEDSWEPKENLSCPERIDEFEENLMQNTENLQQLGNKRKNEAKSTNAGPLSKRIKSPKSINPSPAEASQQMRNSFHNSSSIQSSADLDCNRHTCGDDKFRICPKCFQFRFHVKGNRENFPLLRPGEHSDTFQMELSDEVYHLLQRREAELRLFPRKKYEKYLKIKTEVLKFKEKDVEIRFSSSYRYVIATEILLNCRLKENCLISILISEETLF